MERSHGSRETRGAGLLPAPQIPHPSTGHEAPRFPGGEFGIKGPPLSTEPGL